MKVAHGLLDDAACCAYASMKKEGLPTSHFWEVHRKVLGIIVNAKDVEKILTEKGSWLAVADQLKQVVETTQIGCKMFSFAAAAVTAEEFGSFVSTMLKTLPDAICTADVNRLIEQCTKESNAIKSFRGTLFMPRDIVLTYRGIPITLSVFSAAEEISMRLACAVKGRSAGVYMPLLLMEEALMPLPDVEAAKAAVSADVVHEYRLARLASNDLLSQQSVNAELGKDPRRGLSFLLWHGLVLATLAWPGWVGWPEGLVRFKWPGLAWVWLGRVGLAWVW